jgi:hypothetical protein
MSSAIPSEAIIGIWFSPCNALIIQRVAVQDPSSSIKIVSNIPVVTCLFFLVKGTQTELCKEILVLLNL